MVGNRTKDPLDGRCATYLEHLANIGRHAHAAIYAVGATVYILHYHAFSSSSSSSSSSSGAPTLNFSHGYNSRIVKVMVAVHAVVLHTIA